MKVNPILIGTEDLGGGNGDIEIGFSLRELESQYRNNYISKDAYERMKYILERKREKLPRLVVEETEGLVE